MKFGDMSKGCQQNTLQQRILFSFSTKTHCGLIFRSRSFQLSLMMKRCIRSLKYRFLTPLPVNEFTLGTTALSLHLTIPLHLVNCFTLKPIRPLHLKPLLVVSLRLSLPSLHLSLLQLVPPLKSKFSHLMAHLKRFHLTRHQNLQSIHLSSRHPTTLANLPHASARAKRTQKPFSAFSQSGVIRLKSTQSMSHLIAVCGLNNLRNLGDLCGLS